MKIIGLLGGMSWESTVTYYQLINEKVKKELGGLHSAKCLLYSVDFHEIEDCQARGDWAESGRLLGQAAVSLEKAGADFLVLCTNTMHKVAADIQEQVSIPLLHIAEVTAGALLDNQIRKVALLGTKYTMEQDFYKARLTERSIEVMIPDEAERRQINEVIFRELCLGEVRRESKEFFLGVIGRLTRLGAQGVILGCTEIGLLIKQEDTAAPLFDTTRIHAEKAVDLALS
ncbi:MAG: aspartate/glutamate racemase family protein [Clostridiales bacterium]